jgi:hypothetical protein
VFSSKSGRRSTPLIVLAPAAGAPKGSPGRCLKSAELIP